MKRFGDKVLIAKALLSVKHCSVLDVPSLRQIDALIALAVFSRPTEDSCFVASYQGTRYPYAMIVKSHQTLNLHKDIIEFANPDGDGFIIMNEAKVPHFTTSIDQALRLLPPNWLRWSIDFNGAVDCEHGGADSPYKLNTFQDRQATPELGICSVGLQLQLSLHERGIFLVEETDRALDCLSDIG